MESRVCPYDIPFTTPKFLEDALRLDQILKQISPLQLKRLMHISPKLAEATHKQIQSWGNLPQTPAWYSFIGDVYKGLQIENFSGSDLEFAQQHMGTLSGLYGFLRPLDQIHPYRLELGYKLQGKGFKNLYEFWGDKVARVLPKNEAVINLASEEYIKVVQTYLKPDQLITPWFMEIKNGKPEFQAIHAKTARGAMARWICKNKIDEPSILPEFAEDRYQFDPRLSALDKPVFTRQFIPVAMQR